MPATRVLFHLRVDQIASVSLEASQGAFLIRAHEPTVASHVSRKDRCQLSIDALRRHVKASFFLCVKPNAIAGISTSRARGLRDARQAHVRNGSNASVS